MATRRKRSRYQVGGETVLGATKRPLRPSVTIQEITPEMERREAAEKAQQQRRQQLLDEQRAIEDARKYLQELKLRQASGYRTARTGGSVKSKVNAAGNYTKPEMRKSLYQQIKAQATQGTKAGQWSARKAQLLAKQYKAKGGGYRD